MISKRTIPGGVTPVAVSVLLLASFASAPVFAEAAGRDGAAPVVQIDSGEISGIARGKIEVFKGIPFAAPPVGPLRWRAPQPVKSWPGIRPAVKDASDCAQEPFPGNAAPLKARLSEDCLYLDVWAPQGARPNSRLPVMVWIHGGGFVNGGISPGVFDGKYFAQRGIVMVSINYRLGRFGFFAHPALLAENKDGGLFGNYGLMDQIAALKWVQRNIAAFGGDPEKVTIFGESAGGMSVDYLLSTPMARGLFRAAIIQSGGGRGMPTGGHLLSKDLPGNPSLESIGVAFAKSKGIDGTGPEALSKLRALPAAEIVEGLNMATAGAQASTYGGPSIDGKLVVRSPDAVLAAGDEAHVPVVVGATSDDLGLLHVANKQEALATFDGREAAARALFDPDGTASDRSVIWHVGQDRLMIEPARFLARALSDQGVPTYAYRFSYVANSMRASWTRGAPHASDVPYAMGTVAEKYGARATPADIAMGRTMNAYWANFAKTGDPNGQGLPEWPRYSRKADVIMDFDANGKADAIPDPKSAELDLVEATQSPPAQ